MNAEMLVRRVKLTPDSKLSFAASTGLAGAKLVCPAGCVSILPIQSTTISEADAARRAKEAELEFAKNGQGRSVQPEINCLEFHVPKICPQCERTIKERVDVDVELPEVVR